MAAPTVSARVIPTGFKMPEGYPTTIAFAKNTALQFWEVTTQPPGLDGGEPVNNTTMLNSVWRTMRARRLKTLTPIKVTAAYDPDVLDGSINKIQGLINNEGSVTVIFPTTDSISFYGYLQKSEPAENKDGEMPLLTITVVPTNWDPVNNVEAGPVFTNASGT